MPDRMTRTIRRMRRSAKRAGNALLGVLAVRLLKGLRMIPPEPMANFGGWVMRTIGPLLPENRIGRDNLTAAFPEKSAAEIDTILRGFGTISGEWALNLPISTDCGRRPEADQPVRAYRIAGARHRTFHSFADRRQTRPYFRIASRQLGLPAICAAAYKLDSAVLYRRPNIAGIDRWLRETRTASMGELISAASKRRLRSPMPSRVVPMSACWSISTMCAVYPDIFRTTHHGQSATGAAGTSFQLPNPRHPHHPPARSPLPRRMTEEIAPVHDADVKSTSPAPCRSLPQ